MLIVFASVYKYTTVTDNVNSYIPVRLGITYKNPWAFHNQVTITKAISGKKRQMAPTFTPILLPELV